MELQCLWNGSSIAPLCSSVTSFPFTISLSKRLLTGIVAEAWLPLALWTWNAFPFCIKKPNYI